MFITKAWAFIKKYWALFALVIGVVVGIVFFRQRGSSFVDDLKKIQEAHEDELKRIDEARMLERQQHEENLKRLNDTLVAVQKQYDEAKRDLDAKKKAEIEKLVKKHGDDPEKLAKELSALTGFTVIMPD